MNYIKITDRYGNSSYFPDCKAAATANRISKITVWRHLREETTDRRGRKFELIEVQGGDQNADSRAEENNRIFGRDVKETGVVTGR